MDSGASLLLIAGSHNSQALSTCGKLLAKQGDLLKLREEKLFGVEQRASPKPERISCLKMARWFSMAWMMAFLFESAFSSINSA